MDKTFNILVITTAFPRHERDIISPWLVKELLLLKERGHRVKVLTSSYRALKQKDYKGLEIFRFRYAPRNWEVLTHDVAVPERVKQGISFKLLVIPYLKMGFLNALWLALKEKFDVVHVHWPVPHILFALPFKLRKSTKIVAFVHGSEIALLSRLNQFLKKIIIKMMSACDMIFANSSYIKNKVKDIGIKARVELLPLGNPHEQKIFPYSRKEQITILFVGRLIEIKGLPVLLKAFEKVLQEYPDARLNVVGDGPLMRYSVELAKELGIFKNVIFSGFLAGEPLKDSFRNATMLVLPSITTRTGETEGLGMVLVEAISFGIPVIGSNIGGIPDIIIDGKTGLLFQPGNDVELAEKILLLIKNESLRRTLVEEGQKHIIENFSWDYIINKLETTILELTGKNSI